MFLSSRWGLPSFIISNMPASEYQKQKLFWTICPWGITDDLTAMQVAQSLAHRVKDIPLDIKSLKAAAISQGKYEPFIIETEESLRASIFSFAEDVTNRIE